MHTCVHTESHYKVSILQKGATHEQLINAEIVEVPAYIQIAIERLN
jgi:hypothetical protein